MLNVRSAPSRPPLDRLERLAPNRSHLRQIFTPEVSQDSLERLIAVGVILNPSLHGGLPTLATDHAVHEFQCVRISIAVALGKLAREGVSLRIKTSAQ